MGIKREQRTLDYSNIQNVSSVGMRKQAKIKLKT